MKKTLKVLLIAIVLIAAMSLVACSAGAITQVKPDEGATVTEITGKCTIERDGNKVRVTCDTNIANGAIVRISIDGYEGTMIDSKTYTKGTDSFYGEFTIDEKTWPDTVYGTVVCSPSIAEQPKDILEKYGAKFQNIKGEVVIFNTASNIIVIQSDALEL